MKSNSGKITLKGMLSAGILVVAVIFLLGMCGRLSSGKTQQSSTTTTSYISKDDYIEKCETITFEALSRNPDKYKGKSFKFTGEVIQAIEPSYGTTVALRIDVTKTTYGWTDTIYAEVDIPKSGDRILENDIITFYGNCEGLYTYKTILGAQVSLPKINIKYYELENESSQQHNNVSDEVVSSIMDGYETSATVTDANLTAASLKNNIDCFMSFTKKYTGNAEILLEVKDNIWKSEINYDKDDLSESEWSEIKVDLSELFPDIDNAYIHATVTEGKCVCIYYVPKGTEPIKELEDNMSKEGWKSESITWGIMAGVTESGVIVGTSPMLK